MVWDRLADPDEVEMVMEALKNRGITAEFANTKEEALQRIKDLIPAGAEVMTGSSTTLKQIGFTDFLKSDNHPWKNLKGRILAEKDREKQMELRKASVSSDYFLASVHGISHDGRVVIASATGSQVPSDAYTSKNIIWVVGTQKIVPTLDDALRRVREYCLPLEDQHMKNEGASGSTIGKMLIFEREINPNRKITLIFVNEKLGF